MSKPVDSAGPARGHVMPARDEQTAYRCVLMRGGTSKALFFHESDVPAAGPERDRMLKRAMGTPDLLQIDGLGGSRLVTSKVALIRRSARADADVDYTFAQVDVEQDRIGYDANCGNISSAVGPFAIDEGLVDAVSPVTTVRVYNTNTDRILVMRIPVANGKARVQGECVIPGVPGTGAEILMDYAGTVGAKTGTLLPTGHAADTITLESGRVLDVSVGDAANPCVFVAAEALGLTGNEFPDALSGDAALMETVSEIQAKAGQRIGMWSDWTRVKMPGIPLMVLVARAETYRDATGAEHAAADMDIRARLIFLGKCHDSMAGTGAMCTAAISRVPGSVVNRLLADGNVRSPALRIGHPLGVMDVRVEAEVAGDGPASVRIRTLGLVRTARRLMAGEIYVPAERRDSDGCRGRG
ncbi:MULTISPECIES: PrpF domain-containing protein [Cupriavidus]